MKYLAFITVFLCIPPLAWADERISRISDRVIELLRGEVEVHEPTTLEEEILRLVRTAKFDPVPMAFHRQHLDQIIDLQEGRVVRTYYDYLGTVTRQQEMKVDQRILKDYVASLVTLRLETEPGVALPGIVRVFPSGARPANKPEAGNGVEAPGQRERH